MHCTVMNEDTFMQLNSSENFLGVGVEERRAVFNFRGELGTFLFFKNHRANYKIKKINN